jgi:predicted Holliday junction resolvase-like endonuclease
MPDTQILIILVLLAVIGVLIATTRSQARKQYQSWCANDLEKLKAEHARNIERMKSDQLTIARREARVELEVWKVENETHIRQDAITRSHAVNLGKITEHLIPYMSVFPYNAKDARFIGSPVDLIVFDGADDGSVREIIFLEVKTGRSAVSTRQKQIKAAITSGKVSWRELRI